MSEPERPFLPMSGELGGDFMSGMADSIRERRAREVPGKEGVEEEMKKIRSMIFSLTKLLLFAGVATVGAILSADHLYWSLLFSLGAVAGYAASIYIIYLLIGLLKQQHQMLQQLRRR
jgi:hypothetical protein